MGKIARIHGACAVIALQYASGKPLAHVLDVCRWHGFTDNGGGMEDHQWQDAAKDLGIRRRAIKSLPVTVGAFIKKHPTGAFLVTTYNHIFFVINGGIVSHLLQDKMDRRCKIEGAWRVY